MNGSKIFALGTKLMFRRRFFLPWRWIEVFEQTWQDAGMWLRLLTALICLTALFAELALDTSTSFVRADQKPAVGKLVVMKTSIEKKQSIAQLPGAPADSAEGGSASDDCCPNDLLQDGSDNCQVGHVTMPALLNPVIAVSRLLVRSGPDYQDPRLPTLQKPPSA